MYDRANGSTETYRRDWLGGLTLDDQLFHQSLVSLRRLDEVHRGHVQPYSEYAFLHLVRRGLVDQEEADRPWDASTRSMRYSATLADRRWEMVVRERSRVGFLQPSLLLRRLIGDPIE